MDINQVRFGSYSIGNSSIGARKSEAKAKQEAPVEAKSEGVKNEVSADELFNAMNIAGLQNKAQINISRTEVNPMDYLSEDRIKDIEAMMGKFESGVNQVADMIEAEFPSVFSQQDKLALAANVYAAE